MTISFKKTLLVSLFITSLVIANVISNKIVHLGPLVVPGGFLLYAITFLVTDLISELYGKASAKVAVNVGFIAAVFAMLMIWITKALPVPVFGVAVGDAYSTLLGSSWRIVLASMIAYYSSQSWDVWFFHFLKEKTNGKHKWLRNNLSTMTSQAIDTTLFISIAFAGIVPGIMWMMFSQYVVKLAIAALDTPLFYYFSREKKV